MHDPNWKERFYGRAVEEIDDDDLFAGDKKAKKKEAPASAEETRGKKNRRERLAQEIENDCN